ncbi:hypothetical protein ACFWBB_09490 [Streptomyces sp. NPDC060000]|uniref:hypothetical protein n=1 Tax=Streptomyces sp. NPDC060000 TaxID=3347031 RepID=UPI0036A1EA14
MAEPNLVVDPDGLKGASEPLARLGEHITVFFKGLSVELSAMGSAPWGNDRTGQAFAERYLPQAEGMVKGGSAVGDLMRGSAQGLKDMARLFETAGNAAEDVTKSLTSEMGGSRGTGGRGHGKA